MGRVLPVAGKCEVTKGRHQYMRDDDAEQVAASRGVPLRIAIVRCGAKMGEKGDEIVVRRRYVVNAREERIMNLVSQGVTQ